MFEKFTTDPVYMTLAVSTVLNLLGAVAPKAFKGTIAPKVLEFSRKGGPDIVAALKMLTQLLSMVVTALKAVTGEKTPEAKDVEEKKDA